MDKGGSFRPIFIVMSVSLLIAFFWDSFPPIKNAAHFVLDPTAGFLLNWNTTYGMLALIFIISLFITLLQKYATDQETLKELKKEQKILQGEMKKFKEHPEKLMELQKKQFEFIPQTMKLSMRPIIFSGVPLILFFRWFQDVFSLMGDYKFFGILGWFGFYLITSIIFNMVLRKILKVV